MDGLVMSMSVSLEHDISRLDINAPRTSEPEIHELERIQGGSQMLTSHRVGSLLAGRWVCHVGGGRTAGRAQ